jgi:glycosyltransferase involved in cell wall biosynthesis
MVPEPSIRVLHVVSTNERRGAEMFVADLVGAVEDPGIEQQVAVLRDAGRPPVPFGSALTMVGRDQVVPLANVNVGTALALRRLVRRGRLRIVLAHGGEALKYAVAVRGSAALVYRRVGATPAWMAGRARRRVYGALMRRADAVVAVSEATRRDTIAAFGLDPARTITIPNAVDHRRVEPKRGGEATRAELGIAHDAPVALFVGALNEEKDPLLAVDVARRAFATVPQARLLIVGEGSLRDEVAGRCEAAGLSTNVSLLGSRADIGDLLAAADALLLTSRTEGMPGVVIEAGMAGVPVVGHSVGGVPEVVVDGQTGVLAPFGDVGRLADGLVRVLTDGEVRERLGGAGRTRCHALFDVSSVARSYERLFRTMSDVSPSDGRPSARASAS